MDTRPALDGESLTRLARGRALDGIWVEPVYRELGYADALSVVWLRAEVVQRLTTAAGTLAPERMGLLIWDGWRPKQLQRALWEEYRDDLATETGLSGDALDARTRAFVSHPDREPPPAHATGGAVDLTLCDLEGAALDMGGAFDELSDRSVPEHYERPALGPEEQLYRDRRRLLRRAMTEAGFWQLPTEWWHFEWGTDGWAAARGGRPRFGEAVAPPR